MRCGHYSERALSWPWPWRFLQRPSDDGKPHYVPFSLFYVFFCISFLWQDLRLCKTYFAPDIVAAWLMLRKCFGALFDVFFPWFLGICDVSFRSTDVLNLDFAAFHRDTFQHHQLLSTFLFIGRNCRYFDRSWSSAPCLLPSQQEAGGPHYTLQQLLLLLLLLR